MIRAIIWAFIAALITSVALAETPKKPGVGMNHMSVTAPEAPAAPEVAKPEAPAANDPAAPKQTAPLQETTQGKDLPYFAKVGETSIFPHTAALLRTGNPAVTDKALESLADMADTASPQILLTASEILADRGDLQKSAFYHQAALLRGDFEIRRCKPSPARVTVMNNLRAQATRLNEAVYPYLISSPQILTKMLKDVVVWDQNTRFSYAPLCASDKLFDEKTWENHHKEARENFVKNWQETANQLFSNEKPDFSKILDK